MNKLIKSFLYNVYALKAHKIQYIPILFILIISQFISISGMKDDMTMLISILTISIIFMSAPLIISVCRNIMLLEGVENQYVSFFKKDYFSLYIRKLVLLMLSMLIITVLIILVNQIILLILNNDNLAKFLYPISLIYIIYIYTRILFILPASAVGEDISILESFKISKRYSIKIFTSYILLIAIYSMPSFFIYFFNLTDHIKANTVLLYAFSLLSILIVIAELISQTVLISLYYKEIRRPIK
tara:strand:+ start:5050 stop:5778 length:729 start_codon:yes stop_codon:yes gene_type:complete